MLVTNPKPSLEDWKEARRLSGEPASVFDIGNERVYASRTREALAGDQVALARRLTSDCLRGGLGCVPDSALYRHVDLATEVSECASRDFRRLRVQLGRSLLGAGIYRGGLRWVRIRPYILQRVNAFGFTLDTAEDWRVLRVLNPRIVRNSHARCVGQPEVAG